MGSSRQETRPPAEGEDISEECCDGCRFWETLGDDRGHCHRSPPRLSDHALRFYAENPGPDDPELPTEEMGMLRAVRSLDVWFWPVTSAADWCGEWKPLNAPEGKT